MGKCQTRIKTEYSLSPAYATYETFEFFSLAVASAGQKIEVMAETPILGRNIQVFFGKKLYCAFSATICKVGGSWIGFGLDDWWLESKSF